MIQNETKKLATLNQAQYIALNEKLEEIDSKINELSSKVKRKKRKQNTLALRDPVAREIYDTFMQFFPKGKTPAQTVHYAQMRIVVVVLYTTGARVNEIKELTYDDFKNVPKTGSLSLKQTKTNEYRMVYFGTNIVKEFEKINDEVEYIFKELGFSFLGCSLKDKENSMNKRSWIRKVNAFLFQVKRDKGLALQLKSHSFRIGFINSILQKSDISKAAALVGHASLDTTKRYLRYVNSSSESRQFVDDALGFKKEESKDKENN